MKIRQKQLCNYEAAQRMQAQHKYIRPKQAKVGQIGPNRAKAGQKQAKVSYRPNWAKGAKVGQIGPKQV